jgi:hypothetical protein
MDRAELVGRDIDVVDPPTRDTVLTLYEPLTDTERKWRASCPYGLW